MSGQTNPDISDEARRLVRAGNSANVTVRLLGGLAVRLHSKNGPHRAFDRQCADIDIVTTRKAGAAVARVLVAQGYSPHERFNALNGAERLVFYDLERGRHIDVFVGSFRMCHELPIAARIQLDPLTIPLAELLLTKLQVVRLTKNDISDIAGLLFEHEITDADTDTINGSFIASVLASDWGLWRTTQSSLTSTRNRIASLPLTAAERALVTDRLDILSQRVDREPKTLRWRVRSRVGDRVRWYQDPEEIAHGPSAETQSS